jgi:hypothetical protein
MIIGGAVLPVGLLLFAATCSQHNQTLFWLQVLAGVPIGAGIQIITLQSLAYVLDIYTTNANSAVSGTVIVRSMLGGLFPLVAVPMYESLGVSAIYFLLSLLHHSLDQRGTGSLYMYMRERKITITNSTRRLSGPLELLV